MYDLTIDVLQDLSSMVVDEAEKKIATALEACGLTAEKYAKLKCPVGTPESTGIPGYMGGTLRNSISHEVHDNVAYVGTNVYYAPYVEMGTVKMKAQPYLEPAITEHVDEYKSLIESYLKD